jgi:hypothetical protein
MWPRSLSLWRIMASVIVFVILLSAEAAVIIAIDLPGTVSAPPYPARRYAGPASTRQWELRAGCVDSSGTLIRPKGP